MRDDRFAARFWARVEKTPACWLWNGPRLRQGYGTVRINGRSVQAHRVAFELVNGPIPKGKLLLHSCDNPPCVNPAHLRAGTQSENMRQAYERGTIKKKTRNPHLRREVAYRSVDGKERYNYLLTIPPKVARVLGGAGALLDVSVEGDQIIIRRADDRVEETT